METVRKFRWIWGWQDDVEEKWLSDMSRQGLHLKSVDLAGFYSFQKGESANYAYCLDYQTNSRVAEAEYLQLFNDAGWDKVARLGPWYYFRKTVKEGETAAIFTDAESKIAKYRRLQWFLLGILPVFTAPIWIPLSQGSSNRIILAMAFLEILILLWYGYALIKLNQKIHQLKRAG